MTKPGFRPSVNGLRGLAVLMVILFHWSHIRGGFTGVDLFFVISGYLISDHIARDLKRGSFSFLGFYAKRTRRIVPSLLVILLFSGAVGWLWSFEDQVRSVGNHVQAGALFLSNIRLYGEAGYFDAAVETKPLMHLWSLGIEEQFYLIWPLLLWAAFKLFRRIEGVVIAAAAASFALNVYWSRQAPGMDFYLLPSRLWELAAGGLVLISQERFKRFYESSFSQIAGLLLILSGCILIRGQSGFPGLTGLIPVAGAAFLLGAPESALVNRWVLSSRVLGFLGFISYPLYLWHWPLYSFMKSLMLNDSMIVLTVTAFALAYLTHRWIEKPCMEIAITPMNRLRVLSVGFGALAVMAVAGGLAGEGRVEGRMRTTGLPSPVNQVSGIHCTINGGAHFSTKLLEPCDRSENPGAPVILLLGDSHAGSLTDGIDDFASHRHLNLVSWSATYCTPLSLHDARSGCRDFNQFLMDWIARRKPDLIILDANHKQWWNDEGYREPVSYQQFVVSKLKELQAITGKSVLLVGQNPTWEISLTRVINIAFRAKGMPVPERTWLGLESDSVDWDKILKDESEKNGVPYFSIRDELCTLEGCRIRVGDHLESDLMEFDYGHLSHEGSLFVARHGLETKLGELLDMVSKVASRK